MSVFHTISTRWKSLRDPDRRIGIWQNSELYGYEHKPNSQGRHRGREFDVLYSIASNGCRNSPSIGQDAPSADVCFLGCSWTFGHGVADSEPFPAVVAQETGLKCENHGVMGWGTAHALLKLQEILSRNTPPASVVYSLLPDHIIRNATRASWVNGIANYKRRHPCFRVSEGKLKFSGLCRDADVIPDSTPELTEIEVNVTSLMIRQMGQLCSDNGVPFRVIILKGNLPFRVCQSLAASTDAVIDLTHLRIEAFRSDDHPNPCDHRRIAFRLEGVLKPV